MNTKTKKKVILLAVAVCLLAIAAFGTMAYFTSRSEVNNTFTSGNINVVMDESEAVQGIGEQKWTLDKDVRVTENNYEDVMAGDKVSKDPTVWNKGKNDAYVAVMIYMPKSAIDYLYKDDISEEKKNFIKSLDGLVSDSWTVKSLGCNDSYYGYRLTYKGDDKKNGILGAGKSVTIFTAYNVPRVNENNTSSEQENTMEMSLEAYAVQVAGFGQSADTDLTNRNTALTTAFNDELYIGYKPLTEVDSAA